MGKLIIPNEINIKGPWILDENQLEDLSEILALIEDKINSAFEVEFKNEIERKINERREWDKNLDEAKIESETSNYYPYNNKEKYAILISKDRKIIKDLTIIDLLKDQKIKDFNPSELQVEINKGSNQFRLEISSRYDGGELQTRLTIKDENLANEINYLLNRWIRKNQPNNAIQIWSSVMPFAAFFSLIALYFISGLFLSSNIEIYQKALNQQGLELLKDSLTDNEISQAIELILKKETGYLPENYTRETQANSKILKIWLYGTIVILMLAIKPKTTISLGKKKRVGWFYKKWIYFVTFFVPMTIILPIILERIF
ncbi:MAG: hypothetical protein ACK5M7_16680 [Draconibacterium sp.]